MNYIKRNIEKTDFIENAQKAIPKLLKELKIKDGAGGISDEYPYLVEFFNQTTTQNDDIDDIYGELITYHSETLSNCIKLISMYKVLPLTNIENKRTFSKQNRVKTKFRASLEEDLLVAILKVNVTLDYGKSENDEFIDSIIEHWRDVKERYFYNEMAIEEE